MRRPWFRLRALMGCFAVACSLCCDMAPEATDVPTPTDWALLPEPVRGPIREAVERCRQNPRDPEAFERLARIYHGNEQTVLAAECYGRAIELGSTEAMTHYLLGLIHRQSGRSDAAIEVLREAAVLQPAYAPTHYNLGEAFLDAVRARAVLVQCASDELLSRTRFTGYQHRHAGAGKSPDRTEYLLHRRRLSDY